jgi:hypothetical protein
MMKNKFQTDFWVDKTPSNEMILASPTLKEIWPGARFIFMKRRGIENVMSRQRKFSENSFKIHCTDWADAMAFWEQVRDGLNGCAIEVDQLEMAKAPRRVGEAIGEFLELARQETQELLHRLETGRVEQTSGSIFDTFDIDSLGWSSHELETFNNICGEMMKNYGYSYDGAYFRREYSDNGVVIL